MLFGNKRPRMLMNPANPGAQQLLQPQAPQQDPMQMQQAMQGMIQPPQPEQQPGGKVNWLGVLADGLSGTVGGRPMYLDSVMSRRQETQKLAMQQQQRQQELADNQMKRDADWQDWQKQEQWKRDNPMPRYNDTIEDFNWYKSLSPEDKAVYDIQHPVIVQGPDGPYAVPRSALGQGGAPAATGGDLPEGYQVRGGGGGGAPGGFPVAQGAGGFPSFSKAIIGQESGGRYGVANTEGSGAMGIGQIMPDTARSLSRRIGRPYRPDLLAGTSPEARDYQNALTNAALQEAWQYGGGDPRKAAYYYFAGPDKKGWGPKTKRYGEDIVRRMGGK